MFQGLLSDHNILIVVADSLRLDVARSSRLPFLDRHCVIHECDASANFTYPAHAALMAGFTPLPDGREFKVGDWRVSRLWRSTSGRARDAAVGLTFSGPSLISASEAAGRTTVGFGGVQFFDPASGGVTLATHFRDFRFAGIRATEALIAESSWSTASQLPALPSISGLERPAEPWTIFVNSAATHFPYACDTSPVVDRDVDFLHFAGKDAIEQGGSQSGRRMGSWIGDSPSTRLHWALWTPACLVSSRSCGPSDTQRCLFSWPTTAKRSATMATSATVSITRAFFECRSGLD